MSSALLANEKTGTMRYLLTNLGLVTNPKVEIQPEAWSAFSVTEYDLLLNCMKYVVSYPAAFSDPRSADYLNPEVFLGRKLRIGLETIGVVYGAQKIAPTANNPYNVEYKFLIARTSSTPIYNITAMDFELFKEGDITVVDGVVITTYESTPIPCAVKDSMIIDGFAVGNVAYAVPAGISQSGYKHRELIYTSNIFMSANNVDAGTIEFIAPDDRTILIDGTLHVASDRTVPASVKMGQLLVVNHESVGIILSIEGNDIKTAGNISSDCVYSAYGRAMNGRRPLVVCSYIPITAVSYALPTTGKLLYEPGTTVQINETEIHYPVPADFPLIADATGQVTSIHAPGWLCRLSSIVRDTDYLSGVVVGDEFSTDTSDLIVGMQNIPPDGYHLVLKNYRGEQNSFNQMYQGYNWMAGLVITASRKQVEASKLNTAISFMASTANWGISFHNMFGMHVPNIPGLLDIADIYAQVDFMENSYFGADPKYTIAEYGKSLYGAAYVESAKLDIVYRGTFTTDEFYPTGSITKLGNDYYVKLGMNAGEQLSTGVGPYTIGDVFVSGGEYLIADSTSTCVHYAATGTPDVQGNWHKLVYKGEYNSTLVASYVRWDFVLVPNTTMFKVAIVNAPEASLLSDSWRDIKLMKSPDHKVQFSYNIIETAMPVGTKFKTVAAYVEKGYPLVQSVLRTVHGQQRVGVKTATQSFAIEEKLEVYGSVKPKTYVDNATLNYSLLAPQRVFPIGIGGPAPIAPQIDTVSMNGIITWEEVKLPPSGTTGTQVFVPLHGRSGEYLDTIYDGQEWFYVQSNYTYTGAVATKGLDIVRAYNWYGEVPILGVGGTTHIPLETPATAGDQVVLYAAGEGIKLTATAGQTSFTAPTIGKVVGCYDMTAGGVYHPPANEVLDAQGRTVSFTLLTPIANGRVVRFTFYEAPYQIEFIAVGAQSVFTFPFDAVYKTALVNGAKVPVTFTNGTGTRYGVSPVTQKFVFDTPLADGDVVTLYKDPVIPAMTMLQGQTVIDLDIAANLEAILHADIPVPLGNVVVTKQGDSTTSVKLLTPANDGDTITLEFSNTDNTNSGITNGFDRVTQSTVSCMFKATQDQAVFKASFDFAVTSALIGSTGVSVTVTDENGLTTKVVLGTPATLGALVTLQDANGNKYITTAKAGQTEFYPHFGTVGILARSAVTVDGQYTIVASTVTNKGTTHITLDTGLTTGDILHVYDSTGNVTDITATSDNQTEFALPIDAIYAKLNGVIIPGISTPYYAPSSIQLPTPVAKGTTVIANLSDGSARTLTAKFNNQTFFYVDLGQNSYYIGSEGIFVVEVAVNGTGVGLGFTRSLQDPKLGTLEVTLNVGVNPGDVVKLYSSTGSEVAVPVTTTNQTVFTVPQDTFYNELYAKLLKVTDVVVKPNEGFTDIEGILKQIKPRNITNVFANSISVPFSATATNIILNYTAPIGTEIMFETNIPVYYDVPAGLARGSFIEFNAPTYISNFGLTLRGRPVTGGYTMQFRRGAKADLPLLAAAGEPLLTTDTHELFVGTGTGIQRVGDIFASDVAPEVSTYMPKIWLDTTTNTPMVYNTVSTNWEPFATADNTNYGTF